MYTQRLLAKKKSKMWSKKGKKISYSPVNWSFIRKMKPFLDYATDPRRKRGWKRMYFPPWKTNSPALGLISRVQSKPTACPEHMVTARNEYTASGFMVVTLRFEYKSLKLEWVVFLCKPIAEKKVSQLLNAFLPNRHFLLFSEVFLSKTTWWEGIYM